LEISDDAKRICRDLMYSRSLPWYLRAVLPVSRLVTAGLLPERLREEYGFTWNPWRERLFRVGVRVTHLTYRHVPRTLRYLPMRYYMRGFRKQYRRYA